MQDPRTLRLRSSSCRGPRASVGFTLTELIIVVAILVTLASLAVPMYTSARQTALLTVVTGELKLIQQEIDLYLLNNGTLPETLADLRDFGQLNDPWGNPYQYLSFETLGNGGNGGKGGKGGKGGGGGNGKKRKDKFLVPLNSTYDLYSMGPDGKSVSPLTAAASRDDIIRANDGEYIGPAANY